MRIRQFRGILASWLSLLVWLNSFGRQVRVALAQTEEIPVEMVPSALSAGSIRYNGSADLTSRPAVIHIEKVRAEAATGAKIPMADTANNFQISPMFRALVPLSVPAGARDGSDASSKKYHAQADLIHAAERVPDLRSSETQLRNQAAEPFEPGIRVEGLSPELGPAPAISAAPGIRSLPANNLRRLNPWPGKNRYRLFDLPRLRAKAANPGAFPFRSWLIPAVVAAAALAAIFPSLVHPMLHFAAPAAFFAIGIVVPGNGAYPEGGGADRQREFVQKIREFCTPGGRIVKTDTAIELGSHAGMNEAETVDVLRALTARKELVYLQGQGHLYLHFEAPLEPENNPVLHRAQEDARRAIAWLNQNSTWGAILALYYLSRSVERYRGMNPLDVHRRVEFPQVEVLQYNAGIKYLLNRFTLYKAYLQSNPKAVPEGEIASSKEQIDRIMHYLENANFEIGDSPGPPPEKTVLWLDYVLHRTPDSILDSAANNQREVSRRDLHGAVAFVEAFVQRLHMPPRVKIFDASSGPEPESVRILPENPHFAKGNLKLAIARDALLNKFEARNGTPFTLNDLSSEERVSLKQFEREDKVMHLYSEDSDNPRMMYFDAGPAYGELQRAKLSMKSGISRQNQQMAGRAMEMFEDAAQIYHKWLKEPDKIGSVKMVTRNLWYLRRLHTEVAFDFLVRELEAYWERDPMARPASETARQSVLSILRECLIEGKHVLGPDFKAMLIDILKDSKDADARTRLTSMLEGEDRLAPKEVRNAPETSKGSKDSKAADEEEEKKKPILLLDYCRDLTEAALNGLLDPLVGRNDEVGRVIEILARRTKNNPLLIGEPGVGKTAIVEGLAQRIADGDVPPRSGLEGKRILSLDLSLIAAGTKYRGQFEERLKTIMKQLMERKDAIVFIDELHTLVGAGRAEGSLDAANILKPALARGEIQTIGATTPGEYRKSVAKDKSLDRRFQPVKVGPLNEEETIQTLQGTRERYEKFHAVNYTDEALRHAVYLSNRYIPDRLLPDKAIDLIDEAGARVKIRESHAPDEVSGAEKHLKFIRYRVEAAIANHEHEKARFYMEEEIKERENVARLRATYRLPEGPLGIVTREDIEEVVSVWTGIKVTQVKEEEREKLLRMEPELKGKVINQDRAIESVARAVKRERNGFKFPEHRPTGVFFFLGPTGVGKTEVARRLAEFLFGTEKALIRFDMSEYMEKQDVSKLIGAPPGHIGYEEGGQLTERVHRTPYSVVLFDEIEKAHPDIFNLFLQLFEDGRLTDGQGNTIDFRNTIIIMTSNLGAGHFRKRIGVGFHSGGRASVEEQALKEVKRFFPPEFVNRVDEFVIFNPLGDEHLRKILRLQMAQRSEEWKHRGFMIQGMTRKAEDELMRWIEKHDSRSEYWAREIRRAIQKNIEDPLSWKLISHEIRTNRENPVSLWIDYNEEKEEFTFKPAADSDSSSSAIHFEKKLELSLP